MVGPGHGRSRPYLALTVLARGMVEAGGLAWLNLAVLVGLIGMVKFLAWGPVGLGRVVPEPGSS